MKEKKRYILGGLLCMAAMLGFVTLYFKGGDLERLLPVATAPSSQSSEKAEESSREEASSQPASSSQPAGSSQESSSQEPSSREEPAEEEEPEEEAPQSTAPVGEGVNLGDVNDLYVIGGESGLCYRVTDNQDKRQILSLLQATTPTGQTPRREEPRPDSFYIRTKDGTVSTYQVSESQVIQGNSLCSSTESQREQLLELLMICQQDYPPRPQWIATFQGVGLVKAEFQGQSADQLRSIKTTITDGEDLQELESAIRNLDVDKRRDGEVTQDYVRETGPGLYDRYRLTLSDGRVYTLFTDDFTMVVHREGESTALEYHIDDSQIFQLRELMKRLAETTPGSVIQTVV